MKANKPCSGHLVDRGGYYHTVIYVLENGKRKPVSYATGLPVKNNLRKAQKILDDEFLPLAEIAASASAFRDDQSDLRHGNISLLFPCFSRRFSPCSFIPAASSFHH